MVYKTKQTFSSKVIWNSICNDVCIYEKPSYIALPSLYNCKTRGSDKFLAYNIPTVMLYIVFYLRFFWKNILNWSLYYAWTMSSEFDKESRINVKNDWRRSWKTITPAFYFHRICMSSLQRHQRRELFTQFWRRWKNLTHHVSSSAWSPSIELSADAGT